MKSYKFSKKSDYVYYLSEIITDTIQYRSRLERYAKEIDAIMESNPDAKFIESVLYEAISDKSKAVQYYLLNLLGDEAKNATSYRRFRKILKRDSTKLGLDIPPLTNKEAQISNDFNKHRNWGLHIPESLIVSQRQIANIDDEVIIKHCEQIDTVKFEFFEIKYLTELKKDIDTIVEATIVLEARMYSDYKKLIGTEFKINSRTVKVKPYKIMDIVQRSHDIQMKKHT